MASVTSDLGVYRTGPGVRILMTITVLGSLSLLALPGLSIGLRLMMLVMPTMAVLLAWRTVLVPFVQLTDDGVVVQNPLVRRHYAYDMITKVSPGYYGIFISTSDHRSINAYAVQKANWSTWTHRWTRADEVSNEIRRRADLELAVPHSKKK